MVFICTFHALWYQPITLCFFRASMVFSVRSPCEPPFRHPKPPCEKDIRSVSEVEWWHNFHIRQQSPSLFQSYFPHESFNVGLLEMALLTELQGGNIDYASWVHQVSGRNGMLKGKNKVVDKSAWRLCLYLKIPVYNDTLKLRFVRKHR